MKLFFDTEFTGLTQSANLLSIGIIDENDRMFYAEFSYSRDLNLDEWIVNNVISNMLFKNLPGHLDIGKDYVFVKGDNLEVKVKLIDWLDYYKDEELIFVTDVGHYDFVLLIDLLTSGGTALDLPKNISPTYIDVNQILADKLGISVKEAFDINRENYLCENFLKVVISLDDYKFIDLPKHNALGDAFVLKTLYNRLINGE